MEYFNISRSKPSLFELEMKLKTKGPIIVQVDDDNIGFHVIIVDSVDVAGNEKVVRIRDPYHAWELSVKANSIIDRIYSRSFIYIRENKKSKIIKKIRDKILNIPNITFGNDS